MKLEINNYSYTIPSSSNVNAKGRSVMIDIVDRTGMAPSLPDRLVIIFDKERTASFFSNIIKEGLTCQCEDLHIWKVPTWTDEYPFGYAFKAM